MIFFYQNKDIRTSEGHLGIHQEGDCLEKITDEGWLRKEITGMTRGKFDPIKQSHFQVFTDPLSDSM